LTDGFVATADTDGRPAGSTLDRSNTYLDIAVREPSKRCRQLSPEAAPTAPGVFHVPAGQ
jgi:hypothetical protein